MADDTSLTSEQIPMDNSTPQTSHDTPELPEQEEPGSTVSQDSARDQVQSVVDIPIAKKKYVIWLISTAFGLIFWGILIGAIYALFSYDEPDFESIGSVLIAAFSTLPILAIMTSIGLLMKSRHAQKVVYWITAGLFLIVGVIAAFLVHALSDPNLE